MRIAWATDIHLDHADPEAWSLFIADIQAAQAQALYLTGDLSEAPRLEQDLNRLADAIQMPIYFVLGNHDYYHGRIAEVEERMVALTQASEWLRWLPATGPVALSQGEGVIGHDGWSDGRHGDFATSTIRLKDYRLIHDFAEAGEAGRLALLHQLGDRAAAHLEPHLRAALEQFEHTWLLMHPPPVREACRYGPDMADDNWAPHFTCKAIGDLLERLLPVYPERRVTVLAGHTHNAWVCQPLPNLTVQVGAATYEHPALAEVFTCGNV